MNAYDYIVVGAGLAGGIIARKLAEEKNKKVKIVERRNHIAGNAYDFEDVHGVRVQKYGPHVIHTDNDDVYRFLTRFCTPVSYRTKCEAVVNGISTPSPFNFKTIDQFCCPEEAKQLKRRLVDFTITGLRLPWLKCWNVKMIGSGNLRISYLKTITNHIRQNNGI